LVMVSVEDVVSELKNVDKNVRMASHSHRRARQRNVDLRQVKKKLRKLDILSVRPNDQEDPRYINTYKVAIKASGKLYEMPIYFNMGGNEIYVKSVWNK